MIKIVSYSTLLIFFAIACKQEDPKPADNNQSSGTNIVSDIDGTTYKTITIGTQTWMAEDLKVTKYNDGTAIANETDNGIWGGLTTGAYSWYNNDITNKATHGALYNWYAVSTMKLCPKGWHIPTDEEWTTLETYLANNGYNYDGTTTTTTNVRDKIAKSMASKSGWNNSTATGAVGNTDYASFRNKSSFAAMPVGFRSDNGTFNYAGQYGIWWSATEENPNCAWYRDITYNSTLEDRNYGFKKNGFCIRCMKD